MYQALRSVSDNHVFVVCRDGAFYDLPEVVRHRGPWQGMGRGDVGKLKPELGSTSRSRAIRWFGVTWRCSSLSFRT